MEFSLLRRNLKTDRRLQNEVYAACYRRVFASCLRILGDPHEAEDLMQESFIKAFQQIDSFKGEAQFSSWVCRIAINRCLDHLKKRRVKLDFDTDWERLDATEEMENGGNYDIERIKRAMDQLPEGCRVVFTLHMFEEMDHKTIAKKLGIKEASSRAQYARAKNKIIKLVNETYV
jgi:RNA polymerase sigma-70 factor (ECF subfamily)